MELARYRKLMNTINYIDFARHALTADDARRVWIAGGGVLVLALLVRVGREFYRGLAQDDTPKMMRAVAPILVFAVLLFGYEQVVMRLIQLVDIMGSFDVAASKASTTFYNRLEEFNQKILQETSDSWFSGFSFENLLLAGYQFLAFFSFLFVLAVVFVLKHIQAFTLALVIHIGPLMLGFGAFGGIMNTLVLSWFWTLVEVSAWGVTMTSVLDIMARLPPPQIQTVSAFASEMLINFVYGSVLLTIPLITSKLVRSYAMGEASGTMIKSAAALKAIDSLGTMPFTKAGEKAVNSIRGAGSKGGTSGGGGGGGSASPEAARSQRRHFAIRDAGQSRRGD